MKTKPLIILGAAILILAPISVYLFLDFTSWTHANDEARNLAFLGFALEKYVNTNRRFPPMTDIRTAYHEISPFSPTADQPSESITTESGTGEYYMTNRSLSNVPIAALRDRGEVPVFWEPKASRRSKRGVVTIELVAFSQVSDMDPETLCRVRWTSAPIEP